METCKIKNLIFPASRWLPSLIIVFLVFLLYWPSLWAPDILDDGLVLDTVSKGDIWQYITALFTLKARSFAALTFRINFDINYGWLPGYRIVGFALHSLNGIIIYKLLTKLKIHHVAALVGAVFFIVHPIQVQAVSYIAQRFTLLSSFFYLLCMLCYLKIREREADGRGWWGVYACLLIFELCAVMSKEIAITIPITLILIDWIFPVEFGDTKLNSELSIVSPNSRQRLARFAPIVVIASIPVLTRMVLGEASAPWVFTRGGFSDFANMSYLTYAAIETKVLLNYLYLILLPIRLHFLHDVSTARWLDPAVLLSALAHIVLISSAIALRKKARLACMGIIFIYIAHLVESFGVVLVFPMFEYRCYLSMAGCSMIVAECARFKIARILALTAFVFLSIMTVWHNQLYLRPVLLWQRSIYFSPKHPLSHEWLARSYMNESRCDEALSEYKKAKELGMTIDPLSRLTPSCRDKVRGRGISPTPHLE